ncbi:putative sterol carrier protein [Salirhabdus euzebyi]|uniref:Putative sterol carrier protein n=1 Tax=Salirhabdus euzebyi TaxID=394506 RepID=A0A841Q5N8_9BACI|nr:SCP2 sterol-binding domain-containing protein [Salirhabdus euzebyi]MBB6453708.1 putative sterol carrier protein [Salirhabdus euzebyi]
MTGLTLNLLKSVEKYLNKDVFVKNNIKFYSLNLLLKCDNHENYFNISKGNISLVKSLDNSKPLVIVSGSAEDWDKIIRGIHGGMHRAFRHKILKFDGDPVAMLSIWKTIWRIGESLKLASEESSHAVSNS